MEIILDMTIWEDEDDLNDAMVKAEKTEQNLCEDFSIKIKNDQVIFNFISQQIWRSMAS